MMVWVTVMSSPSEKNEGGRYRAIPAALKGFHWDTHWHRFVETRTGAPNEPAMRDLIVEESKDYEDISSEYEAFLMMVASPSGSHRRFFLCGARHSFDCEEVTKRVVGVTPA